MSERIWWCETHKSPYALDMCLRGEVQDEAGTSCKLVEKRLVDLDALIVARVCSECGGTFGTCFNSKLKCCPDCTHFPSTLAAASGEDAGEGTEQ